jgi:hypothetical protein
VSGFNILGGNRATNIWIGDSISAESSEYMQYQR